MTRIDLDEAYLQMAEVWAQRSYATRTKVGALLIDPINRQIVSDGYNGLPNGFPNDEVEFVNPDGTKTTNPLVVHAELNSIIKCAANNGGSKGCTLYVTINPCIYCAALIIQAGIKRVVYRTDYRITEGIEILKRAGIEVIKLEKLEPPKLKDPVVGMKVKILSNPQFVGIDMVGKVGVIDTIDSSDCCLVKVEGIDPWYYFGYYQLEALKE